MQSSPTVYAVIPVFNRLSFTRECIRFLKTQTYKPIRIVVADGGSTDGTPEAIRAEHPDVMVLTSEEVLWWSGSMAMGIKYVLHESEDVDDFILMMNNDTKIPDDYVKILVRAAKTHDAAVAPLIVDHHDENRILDAGVHIDWETYKFSVKSNIDVDDHFCHDVDTLSGRGSLLPLRMVRKVGNINTKSFPHYIALQRYIVK